MGEHYTKNTLEVTVRCNRCGKPTRHRVDDGRLGPCLECMDRRTAPVAPEKARTSEARGNVLSEKRIFRPIRTDDLRPMCLPFVGKEVTVNSWHCNVSMRDRYPNDEWVGFIDEFALDVPESELPNG